MPFNLDFAKDPRRKDYLPKLSEAATFTYKRGLEIHNDTKALVSTMTQEQKEVYEAYMSAYVKSLHGIAGFGGGNHVNHLLNENYIKDGYATLKNLAQGESNGEPKIVFDLNDNDRIDVMNEYLGTAQMFGLDSNNDGIIDKNDKYFDKLKLSVIDDNGNEKLVKLSSVVSHIDLNDYINQDKVNAHNEQWGAEARAKVEKEHYRRAEAYYNFNEETGEYTIKEEYAKQAKNNPDYSLWNGAGYRGHANILLDIVDPKHTHRQLSNKDADTYFEKYANKSGWVNFGNTFGSIGMWSDYINFAYKRKDANGNEYLQKFNASEEHYDQKEAAAEFNELYKRVKGQMSEGIKKNTALIEQIKNSGLDIETDSIAGFVGGIDTSDRLRFKTLTGLDLSMENLEKVKSLVDSGKSLQAFKDVDRVMAMRKNDDGTYTLKFNNGRTLDVDELYYDSGEFLDINGDKDKRASMVMNDELKGLDTNGDDTLDENEIDFGSYAVEKDGKLQTLKDIGVKAILLYQNPGKVNIELLFNDNNKDDTKQTLYKVNDLSNQYKMSIDQLKEYINHPYNTSLEDNNKIRIYEGRG